jgi:hypothetical protein
MNMIVLNRSEECAKRFLSAVAEMELKISNDPYAWSGCKESAALRRASLDLTRSLADLRRPE